MQAKVSVRTLLIPEFYRKILLSVQMLRRKRGIEYYLVQG